MNLKSVSVEAMQSIDSRAIHEFKIPRVLLMDQAGAALARETLTLCPDGGIVLVCGKGYNGGDGLAAARHLHNAGRQVRVILACEPDVLRDEPKQFAEILECLSVPVLAIDAADFDRRAEAMLTKADCVVDALLGIGIRDEVREPYASLIARMNESRSKVIAADIPSGLDADTGAVLGVAIRASKTATFGLVKQGCLHPAAREFVGELVVDAIGFPPELLESV